MKNDKIFKLQNQKREKENKLKEVGNDIINKPVQRLMLMRKKQLIDIEIEVINLKIKIEEKQIQIDQLKKYFE